MSSRHHQCNLRLFTFSGVPNLILFSLAANTTGTWWGPISAGVLVKQRWHLDRLVKIDQGHEGQVFNGQEAEVIHFGLRAFDQR